MSSAAFADDSLWGKAMSTIGIGDKESSSQSANPPAANPPAASTPAANSPTAPASHSAARPAAPQSVPDVTVHGGAQTASPTPAPAENRNLLPDWFGWGRGGEQAPAGAPVQASAEQPRKAINPVEAPATPQPPPPPSGGPSMWDKMLGSVGLETRNPAEGVLYTDRPKITVPKDRNLPQPEPVAEPRAAGPANTDALIKPPGDYLEKVRGADGNVSGLRPADEAKDKKFFGLF